MYVLHILSELIEGCTMKAAKYFLGQQVPEAEASGIDEEGVLESEGSRKRNIMTYIGTSL